MREIVIRVLKAVESRNKLNKKAITTPLLMDVQAELKNMLFYELAAMEHAGIIRIGDTINDKYIKLNV